MKLLEFPHSHYCEKARWALDFKGVKFESMAILPGVHIWTVRRYAPATSVPVLVTKQTAVQGSSQIIDFLDTAHPANPLTPADDEQRQICLRLEAEMDTRLGGPIRQFLYHRLLAYPDFIQYCFTSTLPYYKQLVFRLSYPLLRRLMYKVYVVSDTSVIKAKSEFDQTMDELAEQLSGRQYLVGESFSRADVTVSSMLSLLVLPPQHPLSWPENPDADIQKIYDSYKNHPVCTWVEKMYDNHRSPIG